LSSLLLENNGTKMFAETLGTTVVVPKLSNCHFKATVWQNFLCWFFHQIASPGSIRGTLRRFRFFQKIRGDIWLWNRFCGVGYTAESIKRRTFLQNLSSYTPYYMIGVTFWSIFWRIVPLRGVAVFICFAIVSAEFLKPRNAYSVVYDTPRSHHSAVYLTFPRLFWFLLCNSVV